MPVVEIFRHVFRNDIFIGFEQIEVARSHLGGNLEPDVQ